MGLVRSKPTRLDMGRNIIGIAVDDFNWKAEFQAIDSVKGIIDFPKKPQDMRGIRLLRPLCAKHLSNGRFCMTERGCFGFAPPSSKPRLVIRYACSTEERFILY
jgi:hypothetical protein